MMLKYFGLLTYDGARIAIFCHQYFSFAYYNVTNDVLKSNFTEEDVETVRKMQNLFPKIFDELTNNTGKPIACKTFCWLLKKLSTVDTPTFHEMLSRLDPRLKIMNRLLFGLKRTVISLTNIEYVTGSALNVKTFVTKFKPIVKDKRFKFVNSFELADSNYF